MRLASLLMLGVFKEQGLSTCKTLQKGGVSQYHLGRLHMQTSYHLVEIEHFLSLTYLFLAMIIDQHVIRVKYLTQLQLNLNNNIGGWLYIDTLLTSEGYNARKNGV